MEEKPKHVEFWEVLGRQVEGIAGGKRCLEKLKRGLLKADVVGEEVVSLKEGLSYEKALAMVAADIEFLASEWKLELAEQRRRLKKKEFWLSALEEMGINDGIDLTFDPLQVRILRKASTKQQDPNSNNLSPDGYLELVMAVLNNPLNASRMVTDSNLCFPEIKRMTEVIIDGDFKPNLRKMIEEWMEDPIQAKESLPVLLEENMPEWLVKLAKRLGQRRKWS